MNKMKEKSAKSFVHHMTFLALECCDLCDQKFNTDFALFLIKQVNNCDLLFDFLMKNTNYNAIAIEKELSAIDLPKHHAIVLMKMGRFKDCFDKLVPDHLEFAEKLAVIGFD